MHARICTNQRECSSIAESLFFRAFFELPPLWGEENKKVLCTFSAVSGASDKKKKEGGVGGVRREEAQKPSFYFFLGLGRQGE